MGSRIPSGFGSSDRLSYYALMARNNKSEIAPLTGGPYKSRLDASVRCGYLPFYYPDLPISVLLIVTFIHGSALVPF